MALKYLLSLGLLYLLSSNAPESEASKILAVYPFPGKSHFMMHNTLVRELIHRGHEVTMITAYTLASEKLGSNYTEILVDPPYNFWKDIKENFDVDNLFELTRLNIFGFMKMMEIVGLKTTEHALKLPKIQEIIHAKQTEGVYDLLLTEQFYQEAFLALAYKYNIPIVTSSTLGYQNQMSQMMGILSPWSFVPHGFMPFTDRMNFVERLLNSFYSLYEDLYREFLYFPKMDKLVEEFFAHLPVELPKSAVMERKTSVLLLNSHVPLTTVRPTTIGMVSVGGMHIYPPKPLPADIQKFLDAATDGAIFFSLGSNVQSQEMPDDKLKMFLDVFGSLKQRILWKFENESITNLPPNVMIKKWLPQSDILAHRNIRVFITHGGLFGTQEGVHYGVPMLGMPFYCDQHLNMNKAVQGGYAISLHFQSITKDILQQSLLELMENTSYKENVQRISQVFRDRPLDARETAMYWIEYVIRHKGAPHLRSAGLDLKWYQFYLLDVVAFVAGSLILVIVLIIVIVRRLVKSKKVPEQKKLKRN